MDLVTKDEEMKTEKINPDNLMLQQADGQWQKFAMFILWKLAGTGVVKITADDMKAMTDAYVPGIPVIFIHGHSDSIEFSIVDEAAARRLAAHDANMRGSS